VIFRLGRVQAAKGPGLFFIIPIIDQMRKVDMRVVTLDIPTQEAITKDNVTVKVNAVCYFRVMDPIAAVVQVSNYLMATQQIAQTTLRSVLGQSELDDLLSQRDQINQQLQQIIDEQTEQGELQASKELTDAAAMMSSQSGALQLRYLQTLSEISAENNSTIIFPLPIDILKGIVGKD